MLISCVSPVDFKKRPCRPVQFKGQGPQGWGHGEQCYRGEKALGGILGGNNRNWTPLAAEERGPGSVSYVMQW